MKFALACLAGTLLALSPLPVVAQEAGPATLSEVELAREIVDRGYPEDTRIAMFSGAGGAMFDQMIASMPGAGEDAQMMEILANFRERTLATIEEVMADHLDTMMDGLVLAYADTFTRDELEALHAFMMSPAGEGFLVRSTQMLSHPDFAAANQGYIVDYMARVPALQQEFQQEIAQLLASRQGGGAK